jgi:t-SNARE complex subunit (syntaxin)
VVIAHPARVVACPRTDLLHHRRPRRGRLRTMGILEIVIIVIVILAVLGYFGRGRMRR